MATLRVTISDETGTVLDDFDITDCSTPSDTLDPEQVRIKMANDIRGILELELFYDVEGHE